MPPKRKAGTATKKQVKSVEKNGDVEDLNEIEETVSSEQLAEVDDEVPSTTATKERTRRAVPTGNVDEPPKKINKVDKKEKDKPVKKGKTLKKVDDEENIEQMEESGDTVKKRPGRKPKAEKNTEKEEKSAKEDKKKLKTKEETTKEKETKGKSGRKAKDKEDIEGNGKIEEDTKSVTNPTSTKWGNIDFTCSKKNANGQLHNLKISCWNIGGLKSWVKKDCMQFLNYEKPDIMCLQETKCSEEKLPEEIKEITDYVQYWCSSDKEGYAGVGFLTKEEPIKVIYGINTPDQDVDGRCITAEYDDYYVVNVYVPNAGRKLVTLPKRLDWNEAFKSFITELDKKKPVIICGDMNVSHNEIDLARPKNNTKNAGFTQEERDGMTDFLGSGYVDTFRDLYPEKTDMYTFWTYMANARSKNIGWRLDYFIVSERIKKNVCDNVIRKEVLGSDHCPITLFMNI